MVKYLCRRLFTDIVNNRVNQARGQCSENNPHYLIDASGENPIVLNPMGTQDHNPSGSSFALALLSQSTAQTTLYLTSLTVSIYPPYTR